MCQMLAYAGYMAGTCCCMKQDIIFWLEESSNSVKKNEDLSTTYVADEKVASQT